MKTADLEFVKFEAEDIITTSGGCPKAHYFPIFQSDGENNYFYYLDLNGNGQYDGTDVKISGDEDNKYMYHADGLPCPDTPLEK